MIRIPITDNQYLDLLGVVSNELYDKVGSLLEIRNCNIAEILDKCLERMNAGISTLLELGEPPEDKWMEKIVSPYGDGWEWDYEYDLLKEIEVCTYVYRLVRDRYIEAQK